MVRDLGWCFPRNVPPLAPRNPARPNYRGANVKSYNCAGGADFKNTITGVTKLSAVAGGAGTVGTAVVTEAASAATATVGVVAAGAVGGIAALDLATTAFGNWVFGCNLPW